MAQIYANAAAGTITDNPLSSVATSVNSANFANLPTVTAPDFMYLTLDPTGIGGLPEIVKVTNHAGAATVCTVVRYSQVQAGLTAASGRTHALNTIWRHTSTKADLDELPFRKLTTTGDLLYASAANTATRLAVGSGTQVVGVAAGIPAYVEATPAGTIRATINTSADPGWALFNQTLVGAQSAYPALWAVAPAAWKSGADLVLPNLADRDLKGVGVSAIGVSGGANSKTIASGNLPVHTHVIDHDHASVTSGSQSLDHTHSGTTGNDSPDHTHDLTTRTTDTGVSGPAGFNVTSTIGTTATSAGASVRHQHPFTTGGTSGGHTHTVDLPNFTGNSGNGGFANTALDVTNAHLAVVYQIKVH